MKRADSGFTLIELAVTLVIAGVLAAIAVPSFLEMIRVNRLASTANELVTALLRARTEAVKLGTNVVVCGSGNPNSATPACDGNWTAGWIVFADDGATPNQYDAGEELMLVHSALPGSYNVVAPQTRITFRSQGILAPGQVGARLNLIDTGYNASMRMICIGVTGKSRVLSANVNPTATCPLGS